MELIPMKVGRHICRLRKQLGLTQNQLGEKLHVSFQAVSKWERGETLPDITLLPELASVLGTTVDQILAGGERKMEPKQAGAYTRTITVAQMREGIACIERMGQLLGKDSFFYIGAVGGMDLKMNITFEEYMADPYTKEAMVAEAAMQAVMGGAYISPDDIRAGFRYPHWVENMLEFVRKYGIV